MSTYILFSTLSPSPFLHIPPYYAAHEAVLQDVCWIISGIESLLVTPDGGVFPLQLEGSNNEEDKGMIKLHVPQGAVRADGEGVLEVCYAVIPDSPFRTPEGYKLCSMTVYLYYYPAQTTKPFHLLLPTGLVHQTTPLLSPPPTPSQRGKFLTHAVYRRVGSFMKAMGSWRWMATAPCLDKPTAWRTQVGTMPRIWRDKRAPVDTLELPSYLSLILCGSG